MFWHQTGNSIGNYKSDIRTYGAISYRPHFHRNYELLYVHTGQTQLTVCQHSWTLSAGQYFLIPPYAIHSFVTPKDSVLWVCVFSADHISGFSLSNRLFSPFRCDGKLEDFLLKQLILCKEPTQYALQGCLYLVCDQCVRNATQEAVWDFDRILEISQIVASHLSQELDLKFVADKLNYEYHYFSRLFHALFGMNFREFVNLYRVEQACQLLRKTDRDISDIALECGFRTVRSFNRAFKELLGHSPSQYRKEYE